MVVHVSILIAQYPSRAFRYCQVVVYLRGEGFPGSGPLLITNRVYIFPHVHIPSRFATNLGNPVIPVFGPGQDHVASRLRRLEGLATRSGGSGIWNVETLGKSAEYIRRLQIYKDKGQRRTSIYELIEAHNCWTKWVYLVLYTASAEEKDAQFFYINYGN